ncbi:MAG: lytic transglycosylase domain-containing protein, partial [Myxococcales bacterium]
ESLAGYEALVRNFPATYYGMLARSRLEEVAPERAQRAQLAASIPLMTPRAFSFRLGKLTSDRHFQAALELMRIGFTQPARDELMAVDRARLRADRDPEPLRLVVLLLHEVGDVRGAHAVARVDLKRDLAGRPTEESAQLWRIAYPLAFRDLIETHCGTAKVEPDLMQALMREESALDPRAHSWAGAVGLCQLMIPTAREVARDLKLNIRISGPQLFDPDLNIRLGSTYFAKLMKRWNGNLALSIASYNAGAGAVNRWLKDRPNHQLDEFVEEIPIAETRNYVKRVLKSYNTYRMLYGEGSATMSQKVLASR